MRERVHINQFFLGIVGLVFILAVGGCATTGKGGSASNFPMAPDIPLFMADGSKQMISDYKGDTVLIVNFWGLRCQNCIEEMPFLERIYNKYGGSGLVILGVNTDGLDGASVLKYMKRLPVELSYPIVSDEDFGIADNFELMAAPLTIVIAKDGTVRYRHEGYEPSIEQTYIDLIEKLLSE